MAGTRRPDPMRLAARERRYLSEINVTPVVDVTLVLLIIFMVTTPMLEWEADVTLPQAASSAAQGEDRSILTLTRDGRIFLDDQEVPKEALASRLKTLARSNRGRSLYFRGDARVPYGTVIEVLDIVKEAGIEVVGLLAEHPRKTSLVNRE